MNPACAIFHAAALAACLSANLHPPGGIHMPGMRRAIQAIAESGGERPVPGLAIRRSTFGAQRPR